MQETYTEFENTPAEFKMIFVEGGVFEMGSNERESQDDEKPVHKVQVSSFWMGEFAVTQAVWNWIMRDTDRINIASFKGDTRPVEGASWEDAIINFLPKLNIQTIAHRPAKTIYRLPTELEWEYVARGGRYWKRYSFEYAGSNKLSEVGWYDENSHRETKDVGLKTPNLLGLYDMSGNVREWCQDWYEKKSKKDDATRIAENLSEMYRVVRGGSWDSFARLCHTSYRHNDAPLARAGYIGFRLVLSFSPVQ